ncbi:Peptidoglycan recognition protein 3 [Tupaia chinensis]|uniref:Peptidoglycan recognition protein 3 n=1 Tax=Tupaia chinensis TaxID=246437 RepID=L9JAF7_TUPCH|nr:Peptidoglycan recognition protein 3 [Tupaia chinensis]
MRKEGKEKTQGEKTCLLLSSTQSENGDGCSSESSQNADGEGEPTRTLHSWVENLSLASYVPPMVARKEWGARPLTCRALLTPPMAYVITDQLSGMECQEQNSCSKMLLDLQFHSVFTKGQCDVAYNFLVGDDGKVYEGVGWNIQGLHTQGYNNISLGIAFFGSKIGGSPSPAAMSAAEGLISYAIQKGHLSPRYIQPLLLKEEICLAPQHPVMPRKACPNIVTRSAWGARETYCPKMNLPAKYVIIIHTAGSSCNVSMVCQDRVRDIQSFHMDKWNFCDIGYHFLVGQDGGVYEGVGWHIQGSHTYGYNDIALGIAFIGNFIEKPPNAAALEAAQDLIHCAVEKGYLTPNYLLVGHSDVTNILSPGQALYNIISTPPYPPQFHLILYSYSRQAWSKGHKKPPNAAALEAAQDLIHCAVEKGYLTPNYLLVGHSDVTNILSPGQALYNIISTWPHFKH